MDMSKKARQIGESTVRSKIINSWRTMPDHEKDKYTQRAKKSNSNKADVFSSNESEEEEEEEEEPPQKKAKQDDNAVVVPSPPFTQLLVTDKFSPEQVAYMKYLMQARVNDYVTAEQYSRFKYIAINKYDQQEVAILMGLLKHSLQSGDAKGKKKWEKHDGRAFLESVYKIFELSETSK
jgi:hypothetical protein